MCSCTTVTTGATRVTIAVPTVTSGAAFDAAAASVPSVAAGLVPSVASVAAASVATVSESIGATGAAFLSSHLGLA